MIAQNDIFGTLRFILCNVIQEQVTLLFTLIKILILLRQDHGYTRIKTLLTLM